MSDDAAPTSPPPSAPDRSAVGLIGVGRMGLPLAVNLVGHGFAVTGYRRSGTAALVAAGGRGATSAAEVAAASDVIITILPDAAALEEVVTGPGGTLEALRPGTVHLEMSTVDVASKRAVARAVEVAGGVMLDCPITGSPSMVAPRLATTFASGDEAAVRSVADVLDALSGPWVYTGEFGTGAAFKYVTNMLLAVHTAAAAEALALGEACGLDLDLLHRTIDASIGGSAVWRQRGPVMRGRSWLPAPGPVDTLREILDQVAATVERVGTAAPVFTSARATFDAAAERGWGHLDIAAVADLASGRDALGDGT